MSTHSLSGLTTATGPIDKDCPCFTRSFLPQEINAAYPMKLNWPGEKVNRVQLESAAHVLVHTNSNAIKQLDCASRLPVTCLS